MPFRPAPNFQLTIRNRKFTVCEHPAAPGIAYGQSGRRALVYHLRDESGRYYALKVFNQTFRTVEIEQSAKNLQNYAKLPGLGVCQRLVLNDVQDATLLQHYPDLRYAVLMPWVLGRTWQEVILMRIAFTPRESFQFANGLVNILAGMERAGLAHCDLSGANVLLPGLFNHQPPVELVDVEEMYLPGAQQPARLPAGTPGYNHQTASSGLWGGEADRFSGAVLVAEMLGWFDPQIRAAALTTPAGEAGEQFFPVSEMQTGCPRFDILRGRLETHWGAQIAVLFERAWHSAQLVDCPSFAEWQSAFSALNSRLPILEETSQPQSAVNHPLVGWRKAPNNTSADSQMIGGRYQILELFSDGGFGAVYMAADLRDNSRCVLKKNKDTSEEGHRQFAREASLMRKLNHPNLARILDYLDLPEGQYLVMELIQGDDLQALIARHGAAPLERALSYIGQICDALDYLHSQTIIHRDVKPANIRITADERAVLMDFGIAKTSQPDIRTTIGARTVSPGFSPPEQYGQNSTDFRADVYALGATVWSMLTGRAPQESVDRMGSDRMFPMPGAVSPNVQRALQRALMLDPAQRFVSVKDFWQAINTNTPFIFRDDLPSPQPDPQPQLGSPAPAWMLPAAVLFTFVCISLFGLGYWLWGSGEKPATPIPTIQLSVTPNTVLSTPTIVPTILLATERPPDTPIPSITPTPTDSTQVWVPAGEFIMGANDDPQRGLYDNDEGPAHKVYLPGYWIDKTEVTVEEFADFARQTGYRTLAEKNGYGYAYNPGKITASTIWVKVPGASWRDPFGNGQMPAGNLPVTQVGFTDAQSYCSWLGLAVPTEAEWEKAARGTDQRRYPWGNEQPSDLFLRFGQAFGVGPAPVGSYPAGASSYGALDMAGNVWEWTADNYSASYYANSPYESPIGPVSGTVKVMRGGGWHTLGGKPHHVRITNRDQAAIDFYNDTLGFRCVRR